MAYETIITCFCVLAAFAVLIIAFAPDHSEKQAIQAAAIDDLTATVQYHGVRAQKWRERALTAEAALAKVEATIAACEAEVRSC